MSSLRDQLLQKGIATKKQAQRVNRELKDERKVEQAQRKSKSELKAEEAALRAAEEAELVARRKAERDEREAQKDALERDLRIRNVVSGNRLRPGRGQLFWHRSFTGPELLRVEVSTGMAYELRSGQAGIAVLRRTWEPSEVEYVVNLAQGGVGAAGARAGAPGVLRRGRGRDLGAGGSVPRAPLGDQPRREASHRGGPRAVQIGTHEVGRDNPVR